MGLSYRRAVGSLLSPWSRHHLPTRYPSLHVCDTRRSGGRVKGGVQSVGREVGGGSRRVKLLLGRGVFFFFLCDPTTYAQAAAQ